MNRAIGEIIALLNRNRHTDAFCQPTALLPSASSHRLRVRDCHLTIPTAFATNHQVLPMQATIDVRTAKEAPVERLLRLTATPRLFRSTDGRCYAQVDAGSRREVYALRSAAFRDWLTDGFVRACGDVPSGWSIR